MSRTTLNIDDPVLRDLRDLQRSEKKPLGKLVSELLVEALGQRRRHKPKPPEFQWIAKPMGAKIDLSDKETIYAVLDQDLLVAP